MRPLARIAWLGMRFMHPLPPSMAAAFHGCHLPWLPCRAVPCRACAVPCHAVPCFAGQSFVAPPPSPPPALPCRPVLDFGVLWGGQ